MATTTKDRIRKIENEIRELWKIVSEDNFWHPKVIKEIKKRSNQGKKLLQSGKLKTIGDVLKY